MLDELGRLVGSYRGLIAQDVLHSVFKEMNIRV